MHGVLPRTRWLVPTVRIARRERSVWQVCALGGYALGSAGSIAVARASGDPPLGVALLAAGAAVAFLLVTAITLLVTGEEIYVFFHHAIAVGGTTSALAARTGMGLARALDYAMIGLGVCLAVGRLGCLMVGCCHGRPARVGIVYGPEHVEHGFPRQLVGQKLVPVQPVEAGVVAALTSVSMAVVVEGGPPGAAAIVWMVSYAAARFLLEFLRGDPDRPGAAGLNHAQWTAVGILGAIAAGTRRPPEVAVFAVVAATAALTVAWSGRSRPLRRLGSA